MLTNPNIYNASFKYLFEEINHVSFLFTFVVQMSWARCKKHRSVPTNKAFSDLILSA